MEEITEYRGLHIHVIADESPADPRKEWDNAGTMVCWHRRYNLGDEQPREDPDEYLAELAYAVAPWLREQHEDSTARFDAGVCGKDWREKQEVMMEAQRKRIAQVLEDNYIILELYLYDHSGISMSTGSFSDPWDSGRVGIIYISHKKAIEEWGGKMDQWRGITQETIDKATKYLEGEVETYDHYLRGIVYGFVIKDDDGEEIEDGSCWGFYGWPDESGLMEEAKMQIDYHIKYAIKKHGEQVKTWIRNKVPHRYRTPLQVAG